MVEQTVTDEPLGALDAAPPAWPALLARIDAVLREQAAHPARSVVLLPYAQLLPLAAQQWAAHFPDSYAPRFETTRTWAQRVGAFAPGPSDWSGERGRDWLVAAGLLDAAGQARQRALLIEPLLELAAELAPLAASLPPAMRPDWMEHARAAVPPAGEGPLQEEAKLARIALAWVGNSDYASDVLFEPRVAGALDALVMVSGLQHDALADTLAERHFEKVTHLPLPAATPCAHAALHRCLDAEDEAERAAACVLRHVAAGRVPVALVAGDRALTRRVNALLGARGLALRDETGWKLSTTHAGATLMAALRASAPQASSDAVLDWLKLAPAFDAPALRSIEHTLRRQAVRGWAQAVQVLGPQALVERIEALRARLAGARPVAAWLQATQALLQGCGLWAPLQADDAGRAVLAAIGLAEAPGGADAVDWPQGPAAQRRMGLADFTHWVSQALEAGAFRPPLPADAPVVVLPMAQLLGRPFAALVLPGADEQRLPAAPEPSGPWSAAQRAHLHLPSRLDLQRAQHAAWQAVLGVAQVDVLWRHSDDSGQALLPSPLVQALQLPGAAGGVRITTDAPDPRTPRAVAAAPTARPQPVGSALPTQPLSASSYEQLRSCPYRFFALRQLGLQEEGELDVDLDASDWGNWVHAVLRHFHEALQGAPQADRAALMDAAAAQVTRQQGLAEEASEFLPFQAAWPGLRDKYLTWLQGHEAAGHVFECAEHDIRVRRGPLQLRGRIDRIDRAAGGGELLIDYKTERQDNTKKRVNAGSEETQLPFYALLAGSEAPQAAYLNLAEREAPSLMPMPDLEHLVAALHTGMADDMERIAQGEPLLALGEGRVCDWCEVRGLCRKDFWKT